MNFPTRAIVVSVSSDVGDGIGIQFCPEQVNFSSTMRAHLPPPSPLSQLVESYFVLAISRGANFLISIYLGKKNIL